VKLAHAQVPKDPVQRWKTVIPVIEELKVKARKLGLWNLFLSKTHYPEHGVPLTNVEVISYFICCNSLLMNNRCFSMRLWPRFSGAVAMRLPRQSTAPPLTPGIWVCARVRYRPAYPESCV